MRFQVVGKSSMMAVTFAGLVGLGAGCGAPPGSGAARAGPSNKPLDAAAAASKVAAVRCEHEAACGNVGPGRRYPTPEACGQELSRSATIDLQRSVCPLGIDERRLITCAGQFQRESCDPLAPLARLYACAPSTMCARSGGAQFGPDELYGQY